MHKSKYDQTLSARILVAMNEIKEPVKIKDLVRKVYYGNFHQPSSVSHSIGISLRVLMKSGLVEKVSRGVYQLASHS
jgi:hypothetical protein